MAWTQTGSAKGERRAIPAGSGQGRPVCGRCPGSAPHEGRFPTSKANFPTGVPHLVLLNKPYRVLCQFTDRMGRLTLASFLPVAKVYPAGRLDYESEGLVLLTDSGWLQHLIANPSSKNPKTYWVQVEGRPRPEDLSLLLGGVQLPSGIVRARAAEINAAPPVWPRNPPIRERQSIPTSWLRITLREGRKHVVRHLTAAVGFPTLRLIRYSIGPWTLDGLQPGEWREISLPRDWEPEVDRPAASRIREAT